MHDIIIIGAGPAGLTAAVYARRAGKTVLLIERKPSAGRSRSRPALRTIPSQSP